MSQQPNPISADPADPISSIWRLKPWWCQPWSILLTGLAVITMSWVLLRLWWLTALVCGGVLLWWTVFLVLVPRAWQETMRTEQALPR